MCWWRMTGPRLTDGAQRSGQKEILTQRSAQYWEVWQADVARARAIWDPHLQVDRISVCHKGKGSER